MPQNAVLSPADRLRANLRAKSPGINSSPVGLPVAPTAAGTAQQGLTSKPISAVKVDGFASNNSPSASLMPSGPRARTPLRFMLNPDAAPAPAMNPFEQARRRSVSEVSSNASRSTDQAAGEPREPFLASTSPAPASAYEKMRQALTSSLAAATLQGHDVEDVQVVKVLPTPTLVGNDIKSEVAVSPLGVKSSPLSRLRAAIAIAPASGLVADVSDFGDFGEPEGSSYDQSYRGAKTGRDDEVQDVVKGRLVTIKEFNGWAIGTLYTEDREEIRIKGEVLIGLKEGLEYSISGRHTTHTQHGEGFDATSVAPMISANDSAIEFYLVKSFDGIGPAKAAKYIKLVRGEGGDEAIEKLRATLLNEPWLLDLTKIDGKAKFSSGEDPQNEIKLLMVTRNLMLRLGTLKGFKEATAKSLATNLLLNFKRDHPEGPGLPPPPADIVGETWAALMRNPYSLIRKTEGYGFLTAESIAVVAGLPRDSTIRLSALAEYAVEEGCQRKGHTFLSAVEFVETLRRLDPTANPQKSLNAAVFESCIVVDGKRVYSPKLFEAEKELAQNIANMMQASVPMTARLAQAVVRKLDKDAAKINPAFKDGFDADQTGGVAGIMTGNQRIHVLTGGPGTGKTAIIEAMLSLLPNKTFAFAAPTGRAAKILTSRVKPYGYTAVTTNSLLQGSEEGGFKVNKEEPLECDVLVLDENTMTGIVMANAVLSALSPTAHLILLGDPGLPAKPGVADSARAGQLPSISPGRFMQDMLLMPSVNHHHLIKTYRNDGGILEVVQQTAMGKLSTHDRETVKFSHGLPEPEIGFPSVMQEYLALVQQDGIENTLLLMPKRKGDRETPGWNATYANHVLREVLNPNGEKIPGTSLFLGDRIIIRENLKIKQPDSSSFGQIVRAPVYEDSKKSLMERLVESRTAPAPASLDLSEHGEDGDDESVTERVVNGDTGMITAFVMAGNNKRLGSPQWLELKLDDGRKLYFSGLDMAALQHAYAQTIHSAQGSEYLNVILVVTPGNPDFMNQNMLNTGESRARKFLSIYGEDRVIKQIAATPMPKRNSALVERVVQAMTEQTPEEIPEPEPIEEIPF